VDQHTSRRFSPHRRADASALRARSSLALELARSRRQRVVPAGDLLITLVLTTRADAIGRRATLVVGSLLKVVAAIAFVSSDRFAVLVLAGTVGVISTSGGEIGPFVAIEQVRRLGRGAREAGNEEGGGAARAPGGAHRARMRSPIEFKH
jgi:hypothetical protein